MTVAQFCSIVAVGGMRYNGSVISWGRSKARNTRVGGHEDSFHLMWLATDVVFDKVEDVPRARKFYKRMGLHVKKNGTQTLHVQVVPPL